MKALLIRPIGFDLKTTARHLGIKHHALTAALRDRAILQPSPHGLIPTPAYSSTGYFTTEARQHEIDGPTGIIRRNYVATLVTLQGMVWLAEELRRAA